MPSPYTYRYVLSRILLAVISIVYVTLRTDAEKIVIKIQTMSPKNAAAVALGRKGGQARAENLTPEQRSESARKAVLARWARTKKLVDEITYGTKELLSASKAAAASARKAKQKPKN
ncbi:MAG: hypothetical protein ACRD2S_05045 [Terriglobales bacterium]